MSLFEKVQSDLINIINDLIKDNIFPATDLSKVAVQPPSDSAHGCMAINAAMILAKPANKNPREVASIITEKLKQLQYVTDVEIAGPGFINLRMKNSFWQDEILKILREDRSYGNLDIGQHKKVNVEFVSVNPTGPLHIGHTRNAAFGDSLCLLLMKAGFNVTREYYINDAGNQIDVLAESVYLRYLEAIGEKIEEIPEGLYPGDYLIPVGIALKETYGINLRKMEQHERHKICKTVAVDSMMELIKHDLDKLSIHFDVFTSEQHDVQDQNLIQIALEKLEKLDLVYMGRLEPPKGEVPADWEDREQLLFKSTNFGDDQDRALKKSNGKWTYFAAETGYVLNKINRHFDEFIMVLGFDHSGYVKRTKALYLALTENTKSIDIRLTNLVNFVKDGEPLKMSKRAGTYVTSSEIVDLVGKDVVRFMMLTRKNDVTMDFDVAQVTQQSKDNPIFYVQYASARCHSILKKAQEQIGNSIPEASLKDLEKLSSFHELDMIKFLASFPRIIEQAATHHEPHRVAYYLIDLAGKFHGLWQQGREDESMRFVIEADKELTVARLALIKAIMVVIEAGLFVFNIEACKEM